MIRRTIAVLAACASLLLVGTGLAQADNSLIQINPTATRSATHRIMYVALTVTCSEDTTSANLTATVTQVTSGGTQSAVGSVTSLGAFECSGEEEVVKVPVRRPTGGFVWRAGQARVSNAIFITADPSGVFLDTAKGRTVRVR